MGEITPAHLALIVSILAIVVPVFSAIAIFLLQMLFGNGGALKDKVHAMELAQKDMEARIGAHVRDEYATKDDIRRLESMIGQLGESQRQYTDAVQTLLQPIAAQLVVGAVHK